MSFRPPVPATTEPKVLPILHPMDDFYARAGMRLPKVDAVQAAELPEPYRSLLAHSQDMTSTLMAFHGRSIHLDLLRREVRGELYMREVALLLDGTDEAVEFGAIQIQLGRLPAAARRLILDQHLPLGQILKDSQVEFLSRPKAFFKVESDDFINRALRLEGVRHLYGRRNTLTNPRHEVLAEIVEILPPAPSSHPKTP
jgi:chorismate-pyruvate lyase